MNQELKGASGFSGTEWWNGMNDNKLDIFEWL